MAKKPTRLRFTEDDLADSKVKKAADKAEKAVDKLVSKKKATKLRQETDAAGSRKAKLRFGKADNSVAVDRPSSAKQLATRGTAVTLTSKVHRPGADQQLRLHAYSFLSCSLPFSERPRPCAGHHGPARCQCIRNSLHGLHATYRTLWK